MLLLMLMLVPLPLLMLLVLLVLPPASAVELLAGPPRAAGPRRAFNRESIYPTILSDQLASLSTGLGTTTKLLEAKRGGSRRPEAWKSIVFFSRNS